MGKTIISFTRFFLFQSDGKNSNGDNEFQEPLKETVKQILSDDELQDTLISVANEVQEKLKGVPISGDEDIPINKRGNGVKR